MHSHLNRYLFLHCFWTSTEFCSRGIVVPIMNNNWFQGDSWIQYSYLMFLMLNILNIPMSRIWQTQITVWSETLMNSLWWWWRCSDDQNIACVESIRKVRTKNGPNIQTGEAGPDPGQVSRWAWSELSAPQNTLSLSSGENIMRAPTKRKFIKEPITFKRRLWVGSLILIIKKCRAARKEQD